MSSGESDFSARLSLSPLPVRVRYYQGEGFHSYIRRLSAANHITQSEVERGLRYQGLDIPRGRDSEGRRQLWRALGGGLHSSAFTEEVAGEDAMTYQQPLCVKCTAGQPAKGRLVSVGNVCLRHQRWRDRNVQVNIADLPEFMAAERTFRKSLVPRGIRVDHLAFRVCSAAADAVPEDVMDRRRARIEGIDDRYMLSYPERVAVSKLITEPAFLDRVFAQEPPKARREYMESAVHEAVDLVDPWRLLDSLWKKVRKDYEHISHVRLRRTAPDPGPFSLAQFWTSRPRWEDK